MANTRTEEADVDFVNVEDAVNSVTVAPTRFPSAPMAMDIPNGRVLASRNGIYRGLIMLREPG
jgi:hypothetical protein